MAAGAVEETITRDLRSTFDAALSTGYYNQIILTFYHLQAAPLKAIRFLGETHYAEVYPAASGPRGRPDGHLAPKDPYPPVLPRYRGKRHTFKIVPMAVLEPA